MMGLGPGRFRPGPQSETEKTPAFALGFFLLCVARVHLQLIDVF